MVRSNYCGILLSAFFLLASTLTHLNGADLTRLFCEMDDVPGLPGTEIGFINPMAIGPNGQVLASIVYWDDDTLSRSMVVYIEKPGDPPQKFIGYNDTVPGAPGAFFSSGSPSGISSSGLVMFEALFEAGPFDTRRTLIVGEPGDLKVSIIQKEAIPEIGAGFEADAFIPKMNHSGQIAYWVELTKSDPFERVYALFSGSPGAETLL